LDNGILDDLTFEDLENSLNERQKKEKIKDINELVNDEKTVNKSFLNTNNKEIADTESLSRLTDVDTLDNKSFIESIEDVDRLEQRIIKETEKERFKETTINEATIRKFEQELKEKIQNTSDDDKVLKNQKSNYKSTNVDNSKCSASEAATMLKVSRNTVYNMIKRGQISAYKKGNRYVVDKNSVEDYIRKKVWGQRIRIITSLVFAGAIIILLLIVFTKIL